MHLRDNWRSVGDMSEYELFWNILEIFKFKPLSLWFAFNVDLSANFLEFDNRDVNFPSPQSLFELTILAHIDLIVWKTEYGRRKEGRF